MDILSVDDDRANLKVMEIMLSAHDYDVTSVDSGERATKLLLDRPFDLMISDLRMSPVNGLDLLRFARDRTPNMPVILVTAYNTRETQALCRASGVFSYFKKPIETKVFIRNVEKALAMA